MRTIILFILVVYSVENTCAQNVLWANSLGTSGSEGLQSICSDSNENYYVLTEVGGVQVFSNLTTNVPISNPTPQGIYISKYSKFGNLLWVQCYSNGGGFTPVKIICNSSQNLIVLGLYSASITIGASTYIGNTSSNNDAVLLTINSNGTLLNSRSISFNNKSSLTPFFLSLITDGFNNIYVSNSSEIISFNSILNQRFSLTLPINYKIADLSFANNLIYTIGTAKGSFTLLNMFIAAADNSDDIVISSFDINGFLSKINRYGSVNSDEQGLLIRVRKEKLVITSFFNGLTSIGGKNIKSNCCESNTFISTGDTSGNFFYVNTIRISDSSTNRTQIQDMSIDDSSIFITGTLQKNILFGSNIRLKGTTRQSDIFIAKLDNSTNFLWAIDGRQKEASSYGLTLDKFNNPVFSGRFTDTLELINLKRISRGGTDMFIAKILDISLRKDSILEPAPYCAGDSISIRYSIRGTFNLGNTFYAQLSNSFGNYDSNTVVIGSRVDTASGIIRCKLPDSLSTSAKYQIRLYSDSPSVNSFPDTTSYLIYARPIADAGTDKLFCRGQTGRLVNNSIADTFIWQPAQLLIGEFTKEPRVFGIDTTTQYIVKAGIGTCHTFDTVLVNLFPPLTIAITNDTSICHNDSLVIRSTASGGRDTLFEIAWFEKINNTFQLTSFGDTFVVAANKYNGGIQLAAMLNDGCTFKADTAFTNITIRPELQLQLPNTQTICEGFPITLQVQGTGGIDTDYVFTWRNANRTIVSNADSLSIIAAQPTDSLYFIELTDACSNPVADTVLLQVNQKPNAQFTADTLQGCTPLDVQFFYTGSQNAMNSYSWQFSDGQQSITQNPTVEFTNTGKYSVTLIVNNGCIDTAFIDSFITVFEVPQAAFIASPTEAELPNAQILLSNNTSGNNLSYKWLLPNNQSDTIREPVILLKDTGFYQLTLIAKNTDGCSDTASQQVRVIDAFKIELPNVFTPNGDGKNDAFEPDGSGFTTNELRIFNRWGTTVFESNQPNAKWNGKDNNGDAVSVGTYYYILYVTTIKGERKSYTGTVLLMRP